MRKVAVLGSTGSIGTQALDVIDKNSDLLEAVVLSCGSNVDKLSQQISRFKPAVAVVEKEEDAIKLKDIHPGTEILIGEEGLIQAVKGDCDVVLNSLMGIRGMIPTYEAIMSGKDIALANKETLVAGGEVIMDAVRKKGVLLTPVDSEHSAIFQCMQGQDIDSIKKLILTGSGGPFREYPRDALRHVTKDQALCHPNWSMGPKITIDSATLMNKGLEVIEAMWLFGFGMDDIDVVIHPQSIIHSMIELSDGAVIAQMGTADMRLPIAYALTYPAREYMNTEKLDFCKINELRFEAPDRNRFPCLAIAEEAARRGGTYPVTMNGVNEVLVQYFLEEKISFIDIPIILDKIMQQHKVQHDLSLEIILNADKEARKAVIDMIGE